MGPGDQPDHHHNHANVQPVLVSHLVHEQSETDDPGLEEDDDDGPGAGDLHRQSPLSDLNIPPRQHSHEERTLSLLPLRRVPATVSEGRHNLGTCVNCEGHFRMSTLRL
jgi:hypothetical protein